MPLRSIYGIQFFVLQLKKSCFGKTLFKKYIVFSLCDSLSEGRHGLGSATYSLFWLFLLLPLRIFIPVWYIISASCICRLLVASSSAKNKMSDALKWILILHQLFITHQHVFCLLGSHTNTITDLSLFTKLTPKTHDLSVAFYLTKDNLKNTQFI